MKLSPPVSSSDLDAAREIARRLHQRRRREDQPAAPRPAGPFGAPRPRTESRAPFTPPPRPAPVILPHPAFEVSPAPPSWDEPAGEASDSHAVFSERAPTAQAVTDAWEPPPDVEVEEPAVSPAEIVGSAEPSPFEAIPELEPYEASPSPFDVELDETAEPTGGDYGAPAPPSWDEIVETCLGLAQASGAMLVDPSGQVFAARGEWPEPGPDAIAAKLVSTMERTLRNAPTRSISAPLMGKHLTAWRVPLAEGLVTAAFIGDAPVRAEARPAIDAEMHRGAGA